MSRPGRRPDEVWRLKTAAIDYAAALEDGSKATAEWDRLRKAALAYREDA